MEILLIQPPLPANIRHKRVLPLGLAYLASFIRDHAKDVNVEIIDALVLNITLPEVVKIISSKKRDVIAISFWTTQAPFVYSLTKAIRNIDSNVKIIFGGVHPTCLPEEAARVSDYCVLHEGEETFLELVNSIKDGSSKKNIKGIAYFERDNLVITEKRPFIKDLDSLPFPAWDLLPMDRYDTALHVVGGKRVPVIGSRGCCYNCSYCVSPFMWGGQVRWRSAKNVFAEMKEIIERFRIRQFHFWDDNLLLNIKYINELCHEIINSNLGIKWVGLSRASHIVANKRILGLLRDSGCVGLEVGIESVDEKTFKNIKKGEALQTLKEACRLQKENGLYPLFTYMSLNPGENIDTYYYQSIFIDQILSGLPWCNFFHPLPIPVYIGQFCTPHVGTRLFDEVKDLGLNLRESWQDCNHHTINFIPNSLLEDIPVKMVSKLGEKEYIICVKAAWSWIYELFPSGDALFNQALKRAGYLRFVLEFFRLCSGKTVKEISLLLAKRLHISNKKSFQYSAITIIVLAQLGIIRSSLYDGKLENKVKDIKLDNFDEIKWKYRLLRLLGNFARKY